MENGTVAGLGSSLRTLLAAALATALMLATQSAQAYRPFDSTHPDVAEPGKFEIELGPASLVKSDDARSWIAPQLRLNYGMAENWEVVLEGQREHQQGGMTTVTDNALLFKHLLREGSVQGKTGLSVATEAGLLLPGLRADHGTGASLAGIIGQSGDWGSVSMTLQLEQTRDHHGEVMAGIILEGPQYLHIRPVAELTSEQESSHDKVHGLLAGFIWEFSEGLALDFAVKRSHFANAHATEFRVGATIVF